MNTPPLSRRTLGRSGLVASRLGLSGSHGVGADAVERAYHELGVNYFFVTARMKGFVEGLRRLILAGHRDAMVIASGAFLPFAKSVRSGWEGVASALGVGTLDVFELFWVRSRWYAAGGTWPAMQELKKEGKVRALGISTHDRTLGRALADELGLDILMVRYNAAHRGAETEVFDTLGPDRPGIVTYTATRWRKLLRPAGGLGPMTAPECYRFVLGHSAVDVALTAPRTWEELAANAAGVAMGPLDPVRLQEVREFGDLVRSSARGRLGFG